MSGVKRCLVCRESIAEDAEPYCSTQKKSGGKVCPHCTSLIRKGNVDALRKLADSAEVF